MSTDYDIHCLTCGTEVDDWRDPTKKVLRCPNTCLNDCRDHEGLERALSNWRPALEAMGQALDSTDFPSFLENDVFGGGVLQSVCRFFSAHVGHQLEVRDEYGDNWAQYLAKRAQWDEEDRIRRGGTP